MPSTTFNGSDFNSPIITSAEDIPEPIEEPDTQIPIPILHRNFMERIFRKPLRPIIRRRKGL
jgi:hypothetical protein